MHAPYLEKGDKFCLHTTNTHVEFGIWLHMYDAKSTKNQIHYLLWRHLYDLFGLLFLKLVSVAHGTHQNK